MLRRGLGSAHCKARTPHNPSQIGSNTDVVNLVDVGTHDINIDAAARHPRIMLLGMPQIVLINCSGCFCWAEFMQ